MRIAALVIALALAVTGCSGADSTVQHDAGTATVAVGETLRIDFGEVNPSVGDNWFLVGEADPAVMTEIGSEHDTVSSCDGVGCPSELTWDFEAAGQGTTTLVFQYCFRTGPDDCVGDSSDGPAPAPVELTVEVTA
jgi:predicted secreted protein